MITCKLFLTDQDLSDYLAGEMESRNARNLKHMEYGVTQKWVLKDNNYELQLVIPGVDKSDIKVIASSSKIEVTKPVTFWDNTQCYTIQYPEDCNKDSVKVSYFNGIIVLTIPYNKYQRQIKIT